MDKTQASTAAPGPRRTGVETGLVTDSVKRPPELERLNAFIGRWITEGETVAGPGAPAVAIVASDIYQWVPGEYFVMHPAYGRIGGVGVGGLEIIGYDPTTEQYQCYFFDSQGNQSTQTLSCRDRVWIWEGKNARCTGVFGDGGKTLTAHHERSDDGVHWVPSMKVVLRKVD
jgi:hypothetical protein